MLPALVGDAVAAGPGACGGHDVAPRDAPRLVAALATRGDVDAATVCAAARLATAETAAALVPWATRPGPERTLALAGLVLDGDRHADVVIAALEDPNARARAAVATAVVATANLDRALLWAMRHPDPEVRAAGLRALALGARTPLLAEVAALRRDPDPRVRRAAWTALATLRSPGALALLAEAPDRGAGVRPWRPPPLPQAPCALPSALSDAALTVLADDATAPVGVRQLAVVEAARRGLFGPVRRATQARAGLVRLVATVALVRAGRPVPPAQAQLARRRLRWWPVLGGPAADPQDTCVLRVPLRPDQPRAPVRIPSRRSAAPPEAPTP